MVCLPQKPASTCLRIVAFLLSLGGLVLCIVSYFFPAWTKFRHNGVTGDLGVHKMCARESEGEWDCRDIQGKDILFFLFQASFSIGIVAYAIFVIIVSMTFCSCCIKSTRAVGMTKFFVVIADLITFNCLMIAIATGLKSDFLGTLRISYGCIMCLTAFAISVVLCPFYLIDAKNTARKFKGREEIQKFSNIQEHTDPETISKSKLTSDALSEELKNDTVSPSSVHM
ncbi:unnamed protein product [Mytilus edulis]|uniref:Uncharacterized protein n=1 Tax=Mytilus edulis TaxID=6550 RepID=A0A8S3SKV3_MYTED|nr:unnamed protein product [Mytilus edulis]